MANETVTTAPTATTTAPAQATAPVQNTAAAPTTAANPPVKGAAATAPEAAPKQPTPTEIRRLKLKLDGADIELPEEQVIALAQQVGAAQKRFAEAAATRKQAEQVLEFLQKNPKEALAKLGIDVKKFSQETLQEILKQEAESPEQKKIREQEDKLRSYEEKEKQEAESKKKADAEAAEKARKDSETKKEQEIIKRYDEMFVKALNDSGLPKTAYTIKRMAELQRVNLKKGLDLDAASLAKLVKEDYATEQKQLFPKDTAGKFDGDKLLEFLGEDVIKAITKAQIAKLKGAKQLKTANPSQVAPIRETPARQGSWRDFTKKSRMSRT